MSDPYRQSSHAELQRIYDQGMRELATLDFTDCEAVISWAEKMFDPCDNIFVKKTIRRLFPPSRRTDGILMSTVEKTSKKMTSATSLDTLSDSGL